MNLHTKKDSYKADVQLSYQKKQREYEKNRRKLRKLDKCIDIF